MTDRKPRRAVFAELLLLADPIEIHQRGDGVSLSIRFATVADLRDWLIAADLNSPDLLAGEHTGEADGRPYRSMNAYPTWHGWEIYANAIEFTAASDLDPDTRTHLSALTAA